MMRFLLGLLFSLILATGLAAAPEDQLPIAIRDAGGGLTRSAATADRLGNIEATSVLYDGVDLLHATDHLIPAADFFVTESASTTNWVTDTFGGIAADSTADGLTVLLLDDTTAEGFGVEFSTPAAVTDILVTIWGRPEVAPGGAVGARLTMTCRDDTPGAGTSAWGTARAVGAFAFGADEDWETLTATITASDLGIAASSYVQCELAREPTHGTDTLTGDLVIRGMRLGVR